MRTDVAMKLSDKYDIPSLVHWLQAGLRYLLFVILAVVVVEALASRITPFADEEKLDQTPFRITRIGLTAGVVFSAAMLLGYPAKTGEALSWIVLGSIVLIAVALVLHRKVEQLIKGRPASDDSILQLTVPEATLHAAILVGVMLIIGAGFPGPGMGILKGIGIAVVFTVLGLAYWAIVFFGLGSIPLFQLPTDPNQTVIMRVDTGEDVNRDTRKVGLIAYIKNGIFNDAACYLAAGVALSLGIVLHLAIAGDFTGWAQGIIAAGATAIAATIGLVLVAVLVDLRITRYSLRTMIQQNIAWATQYMAALMVLLALATWFVAVRK